MDFMSILGLDKLCISVYVHELGVRRHLRGGMYESERVALRCDTHTSPLIFWISTSR
jgi:hypothetical protein